ncbi:DNA polymerase III subunit beta [Leptotrichia sp. oral taxon 223]|uniref:DNA polymerase III subunit beta n=1 Tax=Leptotrichia sp. oral taxon 223 TaxID=712363 RepID=UPI0015BBF956|nr:DNA polymerase III subunit beta [Leptotrichia sp. oral taxon 223]NWO20177.1 DNA polymerase III subunit beta [Leptotrichia sp. oral taxon 223]
MSDKLNATVKTWELLEAVKVVENFISSERIGKDYLKGVCIETDRKENTLILRTTDLKMAAKVEILGRVNKDGKAVVSCKIFKGLLKVISDTDVSIAIEKDKMIIQTENSKSTISLMEDAEFPVWVGVDKLKYYSVRISDLKNLFENVKFSASVNSENEAVNCVRLEYEEEKLKAAGTDTYRLSYAEIDLKNVEGHPGERLNASVPLKAIDGIVKSMKSKLIIPRVKVLITCGEDKILFKLAGIEIVSELTRLEFPDYKTIIKNLNVDKQAILHTKDFIAVLKRAYSIAKGNKEAKNGAIFDFSRNKLAIKSIDEYSEFKEEIATLYTGEDLKISLNVKFLIDFIGKVKDKTAVMKILNNKSTVLIKGETDDNWIYLTMPLALREY